MQCLDKGASDGEVWRNCDACAWPSNGCGRCCQQQRAPMIPRGSPGGSPSSGGGSSDRGNDWSSVHSTVMRTSGSSQRLVHSGRGLQVKVNLPIFKGKDEGCCNLLLMAVGHGHFCQSGWDDQHLLPYVFCSLQRFLGGLALSWGEDATLSDVLQMLDEHYGVVMMANALCKELYSCKQGLGENVAEYRMHLLQQVQIFLLQYPGRIWPKHIVEMKCDQFYEGLNLEYQLLLAHKVDDENPAGHSNLLLAAWKLERREEARDPLPSKTAVTSGSNAICSQTQGNLFP